MARLSYHYYDAIGFDHVPLSAGLRLKEFDNMAMTLHGPRRDALPDLASLDTKGRQDVYDRVRAAYLPLRDKHLAQFRQAIADVDIETADTVWNICAEAAILETFCDPKDAREIVPPRGKPLPRVPTCLSNLGHRCLPDSLKL